MAERLIGKTALVTGAATGIGRAVADRFISEGARVAFADIDFVAASEAAVHERALPIRMDISSEPSTERAFNTMRESGWLPDVIVANAGIQLFGADAKAADLDIQAWQRTMNVNLTGTFLTVKHGLRAMIGAGKTGSIIVTGSPTGLTGEGASFTAYSTSKAGLHGLTRTVAAAYAAQGIRVNTVIPGFTETSLVSPISHDPALRADLLARTPLGRAGLPSDLEGIMVFLASDESSFATAGSFVVDGGLTNR